MAYPVLIVEDHAKTGAVIETLLKAIGFTETEQVANGEEAIARLERGDIRLVLSDYHMRPTNGLELLARMREQDHLADIPFVMVSADKDFRLMRKAAGAGVDILVKPFKADQLQQCLVRAIGREGFRNATASASARS
jgi:two-component system chemotaxis response regulator CheY